MESIPSYNSLTVFSSKEQILRSTLKNTEMLYNMVHVICCITNLSPKMKLGASNAFSGGNFHMWKNRRRYAVVERFVCLSGSPIPPSHKDTNGNNVTSKVVSPEALARGASSPKELFERVRVTKELFEAARRRD